MSKKKTGGVRHAEGERQQDIKEEFVAPCSYSLQPQLLYTLDLFMYKCLSPPLRAGLTKRPLTASGLWKGDTINSLSPAGFFIVVMQLRMAQPPFPSLQLNATLNIFRQSTTKNRGEKYNEHVDSSGLFCLCLQKSISESSHFTGSPKFENIPINPKRTHSLIILLCGDTEICSWFRYSAVCLFRSLSH